MRTFYTLLARRLYSRHPRAREVPSRVDRLFRRYIVMKTVVCAGYGFCTYVLLALLGVDLAVGEPSVHVSKSVLLTLYSH